jgi:hypothetical protein
MKTAARAVNPVVCTVIMYTGQSESLSSSACVGFYSSHMLKYHPQENAIRLLAEYCCPRLPVFEHARA